MVLNAVESLRFGSILVAGWMVLDDDIGDVSGFESDSNMDDM